MKRGTANTGTPFFSCRQLLRHPFSEIRFLERARILCVQSAAPMTPLQWLIAFAGCLAVVVFACTARSVDARILEASKKAGEYEVTIQIDKNPPIIGANHIEVEIKDSGGRVVTDAKVLINYYMPPMPRMVPMFYKTDALVRGGKFRATMNFIMSGPWVIAVKITLGGKTTTAKFNVDAQ